MSGSTSVALGSAAFASLLLVAAAPAAGQLAVESRDAPDGVSVGARVRVLYDDNVLRLREGVEDPAGRQRDDLVAGVTGFALVNISPGLQRIRLQGEYGRDYHSNNTFLNRTRIGADLNWDWKITPRCFGTVLTSYSRAQVDLAEQGAIVGNARALLNTSASGGCLIGVGFKPTVTFQHREGENSRIERRASNFKTDAVEAGLVYNRTGKLGVSLAYRDEQFRYPNRTVPGTATRAEAQRHAVRARIDGRIAERVNFAVLGDYNWVEPNSGRSRYSGFSGGVTLSVRPIPRYEITTLALRAIEPALYVSAGYVLQDRYELGTTYTVSPRTILTLRGGVTRNRYRDLQPVAGADVRSFDRLLFVAAGASYDIARNIQLTGEVRRDSRTTDGAFGTYEGTRAIVALNLAI